MGQIDNSMLNMMQAVSSSKPDAPKKTSGESGKDSDFRDLMNQHTQQTTTQQDDTKDVQNVDAAQDQPAKQPTDETVLQELAAMQILCADQMQIVVVPEAEPEQVMQSTAVQMPQQAVQTGENAVQQPMQETAEKTTGQAVPEAEQKVPGEQFATKVVTQKSDTPETQMQQSRTPDNAVQQNVMAKASDTDAPEDLPAGMESKVFHHVESAPIKVSEATTQSMQPKSVETQVAERLTEAVNKGETKVELQLTPEHLGKITIELTKRGDGAIQIVLHAENNHTRTLLERDLPHMQNLLSRGTQQEVLMEVPRQQESQQKEFYDEQQQHQQHQQQEHRQSKKDSEDFLNQLRLGLVPFDEAVS